MAPLSRGVMMSGEMVDCWVISKGERLSSAEHVLSGRPPGGDHQDGGEKLD